jgi:hypothetical protein
MELRLWMVEKKPLWTEKRSQKGIAVIDEFADDDDDKMDDTVWITVWHCQIRLLLDPVRSSWPAVPVFFIV